MKSFIAPVYTFTPGASGVGTVDLSGISGFDKKYLVSIINQTTGEIIYSTASASLRYTNVTGTIVTLFKNTTGMNAGDVLQVVYEDQSSQAVSISSLPLPSGAATSANQGTGNSSLSSIDGKTPALVSGRVPTDSSGVTQPISAVALPLPSGAATETTLSLIENKTATLVSGRVPTDGSGVTQPISASSLPLPADAATQTTLSAMNAKIPALGPANAANAIPFTLATENAQDLSITGQAAQTATVNNIISAASGSSPTDLTGYRSGSIQIVSTGTAGTFIFEGSNDGTNFQTVPVFSQLILTGTPIVAAITATNTNLIYVFPVNFRYMRVRIATTITGGSIQAVSKFSQTSFTPAILQIAQATAANLNTTVAGSLTTVSTVTTVASVTASATAIPGTVADVASAALTTTTTTATITPTAGAVYKVSVPVTVVSGTNPTLDISIEESADSGTNWFKVYDFQRITATGYYHSPVIPLTGNRVRYVQTVGGTTPSFTRSINRLQSSWASADRVRQLVDRTISLTTLNSTTPNLYVGGTSNAQLVINLGAATTPPAIQLEGSDDGTNFYSIGTPLTGVASSTVQLTVPTTQSQFIRARVSTIGVTVTAGYVLVKAF